MELCERGLLGMQELVCFDPPRSAILSMTMAQLRPYRALQWFGVHALACLMRNIFPSIIVA